MVSLVWMDEFAFVGMDGMAKLTWMEQWMNGVVGTDGCICMRR